MRQLLVSMLVCLSTLATAQQEPIFMETFDRCIDAEDENYGYTGGNDNQWGGDIAKAVVVYQDSPEWSLNYCNGAMQCLKVGTSAKQGSATTPAIPFTGDAVLSFRVAPWEGDSLFNVSLQGGTTSDPTAYELPKHKWTTITIRISDVAGTLRVTFSSLYKHRFFLDDVCVRPADPNAGAIRSDVGTKLDLGLLSYDYTAGSQTIHVTGEHLNSPIQVSMESYGNTIFSVSPRSVSAQGGDVIISWRSGGSGMYSATIVLSSTGENGDNVVKRIQVGLEVSSLYLEGSGTLPDPYSCRDVILLAANDGTVWTETYYWVSGYVLGAVKRYQDTYDGICTNDKTSLVLADSPTESNDERYVTVQISGAARAALNVVDNPELIGQRVKVQGLLLNNNANPLYLGKPGVRNVVTEEQYVRPEQMEDIDEVNALKADEAMYDILGRRVRAGYQGIVIQNGKKYLVR